MKGEIRLQKETETIVLDYLGKNVPKSSISETMKPERLKLLNKEWTLEDWKFLLSHFTEKEIIRDWFDGDRFAFDYYKKFANDENRMHVLVDRGLDPLHNTTDDLETFLQPRTEDRKVIADDHGITYDLESERLGERGLDHEIDLIIMNLYQGAEFTPEGLQSFAEKHGHSMTLQNAMLHAEKINKMLRKIRMMDPRKTGIVDMENEMQHQIKKLCRENNIDSVTANMIIIHGKKMIHTMSQNMGRNIAMTVMQKNKTGVLDSFIKTVKNQAGFLGLTLNDVISQLINSSMEEES